MKRLALLAALVVSWSSFSQEKILEFETTHVSTFGQNVRMHVLFELYDTKLVLNYLDKKTIKQMENAGVGASIEMPYILEKTGSDLAVWYEYQDDVLQIRVMPDNKPSASVTIRSKDDFTGEITGDQIYFSM